MRLTLTWEAWPWPGACQRIRPLEPEDWPSCGRGQAQAVLEVLALVEAQGQGPKKRVPTTHRRMPARVSGRGETKSASLWVRTMAPRAPKVTTTTREPNLQQLLSGL